MSGTGTCNEPNALWARREAGRLPQLILAAGMVSIFRGLALIVSSLENMFWPVVIVAALLFPGGCGLLYCLLARRVAQGRRAELTAIVVASVILFVPYLLLGPFEAEKTMAYKWTLDKTPNGPLLDWLLYGAQVIALIVHGILLAWIVVAGLRLRKALSSIAESGTSSPARPALLANLLLILVGIVVGYLWTLGWFFLGDALGLRGRMTSSDWGMQSGENDEQLAGFIVVLSSGAVIACHLLFRWRWWGLTAGILAGLVVSPPGLTCLLLASRCLP